MAIYSLRHDSIGRSTQTYVGTAGAHARYITRPEAAREVLGEHMPTGRAEAQSWLDGQELGGRKNERVCDKIHIALPRELDEQQRGELVRDFAQSITQGRTPWLAAIHDMGKDTLNPHAHLIVRDKDVDTNERVFGLSKKGSTDRIRELWETKANEHLERAGCPERIDRRSLKEQGIDREPTIHIGPAALAMAERGERPESQEREYRQPCREGASQEDKRQVDYPAVDQGRTRQERCAEIIDLNREREQRAEADRVKAVEEAKRIDAQRAADIAEKAERAARYAQEREQYLQALAERCEQERQGLAQIHAREQERLTRDQWQRAAQEQRQDAIRDNAAKAIREPEKSGGVTGWVLDRINPGRAQERLKADLERKEREAKERQAERDRIQRERDERNRQEQQALASKHEQERRNQQRMQEERAKARMAELREAQAVRDRRREQERAGLSRPQAGPEKGRERERSRPGPGDFGL